MLRVISPTVAYRHGIGYMIARNDHPLSLDRSDGSIKMIVRPRECKAMQFSASLHDQPSVDLVETKDCLIVADVDGMEKRPGKNHVLFLICNMFRRKK